MVRAGRSLARDLMQHLGITLEGARLGRSDALRSNPDSAGRHHHGRAGAVRRRCATSSSVRMRLAACWRLVKHAANPSGDITEGVDILRASAVDARSDGLQKNLCRSGKSNSSDKAYGDSQNKQVDAIATAPRRATGYMVTIADHRRHHARHAAPRPDGKGVHRRKFSRRPDHACRDGSRTKTRAMTCGRPANITR